MWTDFYNMFARLGRELNFQQNPCNISDFTLTLVPHFPGKFKILICLKNQWCHETKGYDVRKLLKQFTQKNWTKGSLWV